MGRQKGLSSTTLPSPLEAEPEENIPPFDAPPHRPLHRGGEARRLPCYFFYALYGGERHARIRREAPSSDRSVCGGTNYYYRSFAQRLADNA